LIKVLKGADSILVANENFSKVLMSSGWAQVRCQQPKMAKNLPYLWHHSEKKQNPKPKNFFHCRLKRLAKSFEGLNSSLAQSAEELCDWYVNRNIPGFPCFPSM